MGDTPYALDLIYIANGRVIQIDPDAAPCRSNPQHCPVYRSKLPVDGVLEISGGEARRLGITVGIPLQLQRYLKPKENSQAHRVHPKATSPEK